MTDTNCEEGRGQCSSCDLDYFLCSVNDRNTDPGSPCLGGVHGQALLTGGGSGYCVETKCRCYISTGSTFGDIDVGTYEEGSSCSAHGANECTGCTAGMGLDLEKNIPWHPLYNSQAGEGKQCACV